MFLDFVELIRATGAHIAEAIILSLTQHKVDILKCRGQAYDGAAAMSPERVGVHARIKVVCHALALYTHCRSHVLNLSIASACKVPQISSMVDVINETFKFFNNSPKLQIFFEQILDAFESDCTKSKLLGLCRTHWVERHTCYETCYELYIYTCCCLEAIINPVYPDKNLDQNWDWDSDSKVKAQGLLHSLKSTQNIVVFLVAKNALELIRPIAVKLQKKDQDIVATSNVIDETISNIKDLRGNFEMEFCDWFSDVKRIVEVVGSEISVPRIAGKQIYCANSTTEGSNC